MWRWAYLQFRVWPRAPTNTQHNHTRTEYTLSAVRCESDRMRVWSQLRKERWSVHVLMSGRCHTPLETCCVLHGESTGSVLQLLSAPSCDGDHVVGISACMRSNRATAMLTCPPTRTQLWAHPCTVHSAHTVQCLCTSGTLFRGSPALSSRALLLVGLCDNQSCCIAVCDHPSCSPVCHARVGWHVILCTGSAVPALARFRSSTQVMLDCRAMPQCSACQLFPLHPRQAAKLRPALFARWKPGTCPRQSLRGIQE